MFHLPKSHGSYVDARTGRRTSRVAKAKERVMPTREQAQENDNLTQGIVTKVRKCPPRFIVCCTFSDPRDKACKIGQTTIYCLV